MNTVLISGTFDPPTKGHRDIIEKCSAIFDRVVVCIFRNAEKTPMFRTRIRKEMLEAICSDFTNVEIDNDTGTVAEYAKKHNINYVARGLRSSADCDYEILMANVNKKNNPNLNTIFFPCVEGHQHISSTQARKAVENGENLTSLLDSSTIAIINREK